MVEAMHNRVREVREARGWTQLHLAEVMGVSRKTVNTIESGALNPSTFIALKLGRALNEPLERLFWLDPEATGTARTKARIPAGRAGFHS